MSECVVIADDLTGGNATGVLLKKMNYQVYTVLNLKEIQPEIMDKCDCVVYPTNSRGVSPEIAYDRIYKACEALKSSDAKVYAHRIDSTLRGNLGSETDAMLDFLGDEYIAIVAPCFPATERVVCGGYMMVEGQPLHKTEIAIDPKTPVKISDVAELFRAQSKYGVGSIYLNDMMHGKHYLSDVIDRLVNEGNRIISIDCVTQEDLDLIADAIVSSKRKIVAVDPGVFTATLARKLITPSQKREKSKILAVVGSVHPNAKVQMENLWLSQRTHSVIVETKRFLENEKTREHEIDRVVKEVLFARSKYQVFTVTGDGIYPENRIDFAPFMDKLNASLDEVTDIINSSMAEIAYRVFKAEPEFKAMYTSGGDVTVAVCEKFGAVGLSLHDEVLPLAACGQFLGGEFDGVDIVTKGGSQGGSDAINRCITYLKEKLYI